MANIAIAQGMHHHMKYSSQQSGLRNSATSNAGQYHLVPQGQTWSSQGQPWSSQGQPWTSQGPASARNLSSPAGAMVSVGSLRLLAGGTDDPPRSVCYDFVHSIKFQCVSALLILANAIVIGFETDLPDLDCWNYVESGCL